VQTVTRGTDTVRGVAVVLPRGGSDRPDLSALRATGLRAALRALDTKLAQGSKQRGELVRNASHMQAALTRVQQMIEHDMSQIQAAMRAAAEQAHHEQLSGARADLGAGEAAAGSRTGADADTIAAAIEQSDNHRELITDLVRAVARATLALERVPADADNTSTWSDMVALLSLLLGLLTIFGVDVDLTPDAPAPVIIELSDPVIGSVERYVDERVHDLLEEDHGTPAALAGIPEQPRPTL
jgi:hypothetical protein